MGAEARLAGFAVSAFGTAFNVRLNNLTPKFLYTYFVKIYKFLDNEIAQGKTTAEHIGKFPYLFKIIQSRETDVI